MADNVVSLADYQEPPAQPSATPPPLNPGSGDGTSGGMEARIAKLEAHMDHVLADTKSLKDDVGKLKTDVAGLVVRVEHLPSKGFIVGVVITGGAAFSVIAMALKAFGLAH